MNLHITSPKRPQDIKAPKNISKLKNYLIKQKIGKVLDNKLPPTNTDPHIDVEAEWAHFHDAVYAAAMEVVRPTSTRTGSMMTTVASRLYWRRNINSSQALLNNPSTTLLFGLNFAACEINGLEWISEWTDTIHAYIEEGHEELLQYSQGCLQSHLFWVIPLPQWRWEHIDLRQGEDT